MEIFKAVILGIVQGLTEFLPVSSSGHLVIGAELLDFQQQSVVFDVCLHLGTLVAVLFVFRQELIGMIRAPFLFIGGNRGKEVVEPLLLDCYIIVATLPAVVVGLFFKDTVEHLFTSTLLAYCMLIVTGGFMLCTRMVTERDQPYTWWRSLAIGCAQAFAIIPGVSRSGSTIFFGMLVGINREKAARFSFLMSIPAILGAAVLQLGDVVQNPPQADVIAGLCAGSLAAVIAGYLAIKLLLDVIRRNRLPWFGYYCLVVAAIGICHYFISAA